MSLDINYLMLNLRNVFNLPKIFTNGSFSQIRFTVYLRSCEGLCVFFSCTNGPKNSVTVQRGAQRVFSVLWGF